MTKEKIPYLLLERGRYYYQRRVPQRYHVAVGRSKWRRPVGADFPEAVDKVRALTKQHDEHLRTLDDPRTFGDAKTATRRREEKAAKDEYDRLDAEYEHWLAQHGMKDDAHFGRDEISQQLREEFTARPWIAAEEMMRALDAERAPTADISLLRKLASSKEMIETDTTAITLPPYEEYQKEVLSLSEPMRTRIVFSKQLPKPMDDDEYHDRLTEILGGCFGNGTVRPDDPDDQDEFDLVKQKLERKIARVARDPDTLSKIAELYYSFAQIKLRTRDKYRRTLKRLISQTGNIPLKHLKPELLRGFRDYLANRGNLPASIRADFTPIIEMLNFAVDEGLLDTSPMSAVRLPKEKRSVEESKWLPFKPEEMRRVLKGVEDVWSRDLQGLSAERRKGLQMSVRALAYTAMRPSELLALKPEDIDDNCIRIRGGKTKSAWRVLPLHPEIADLAIWIENGGPNIFYNQETRSVQTDPVTALRYNFTRLIRDLIDNPIIDDRKALYSLRSTFQNALRRAGAPISVRKAVMGHVEKGAIRHYDDGPEFELLKHWIEQTDPTIG